MEIDLVKLLDQYEKQLDIYEGGSDTHAAYIGGKIDLLKDLVGLGFKVGA